MICVADFVNILKILKVPYNVVIDKELHMKSGYPQIIRFHYQSITAMPEYSSFSFEELRFYKHCIQPLLPTGEVSVCQLLFEI